MSSRRPHRAHATFRRLLHGLALVALLSACQSNPASDVSISSQSSLLAVDVLFPAPLSRDPSLVQVFFVRGPIHRGLKELPTLIPATFVKWSRAYLLDPEPGTYSVVAVSSAYAPPWNDYPIAGVSHTRYSGTSADALVFPAELIDQTRTTIAPGRVAFMGALRVRPGDRIDANAVLQDDLQRRIAERIRPGATSESGLAGWLKRTRMVDLEATTFSNEAVDRESFTDEAVEDLGDSPWAEVIARTAPREPASPMARMPAPSPKRTARTPEPPAATTTPSAPPATQAASPPPQAASAAPKTAPPDPETATPDRETAPPDPETATPTPAPMLATPAPAPTPAPKVAAREPEASPPVPERRPFPGLPPDSPLAEIEFGMSHHEVQEILGPPDGRLDRSTAKAWIPFYTGPGAYLRDWIYQGEGRVVFSRHDSSLVVLDVINDPQQGK